MKHLTAIVLALATIFGLVACTPATKAEAPATPAVKVVTPDAEPVNPPTVVTAPKVVLASEEVTVQTTPAPVAPVVEARVYPT